MGKPWCVYVHTNLFNSKKYIGVTSQTPEKRWRNGYGYRENSYFYNAISKYGWDSFSHEILFSGLDEDSAKKKEIELISKYNTNCDTYGYNLTGGGDGSLGRKLSDESKRKIRDAHIGLKHTDETKQKISMLLIGNQYAKGYKHTDETKEKISKFLIGNQYAKGNKLSQETRKKMSESHKGNKLSAETRMKISQANKNRIISDETRAKISAANKGKKSRSIPIDMLTLDGKFIRKFPSAKEASKELDISYYSILDACKGNRKSYGGYLWRRNCN